VRDHLLGFTAVSGRAETFKAGGKVVKNVTGYDLSKVMAGSWGQLAILTEVTLKVLPRPHASSTLVMHGLSPTAAVTAMSKAVGSRCTVAAAGHMPVTESRPSMTAFRLEGFEESIKARATELANLLAEFAALKPLEEVDATDWWVQLREAAPLSDAPALWRIHTPPSRFANLTARLEASGARWIADWAGAMLWAGAPPEADIRATAAACGAHAALVRAPVDLRKLTPIRHPQPPGVADLANRLKHLFDPHGVLDPRRFN
jgi:glycolate oxidase FAD binding subunit